MAMNQHFMYVGQYFRFGIYKNILYIQLNINYF